VELIEERNRKIESKIGNRNKNEDISRSEDIVLFIDKDIKYRNKKIPTQYSKINQNIIKHPLDTNYNELLEI